MRFLLWNMQKDEQTAMQQKIENCADTLFKKKPDLHFDIVPFKDEQYIQEHTAKNSGVIIVKSDDLAFFHTQFFHNLIHKAIVSKKDIKHKNEQPSSIQLGNWQLIIWTSLTEQELVQHNSVFTANYFVKFITELNDPLLSRVLQKALFFADLQPNTLLKWESAAKNYPDDFCKVLAEIRSKDSANLRNDLYIEKQKIYDNIKDHAEMQLQEKGDEALYAAEHLWKDCFFPARGEDSSVTWLSFEDILDSLPKLLIYSKKLLMFWLDFKLYALRAKMNNFVLNPGADVQEHNLSSKEIEKYFTETVKQYITIQKTWHAELSRLVRRLENINPTLNKDMTISATVIKSIKDFRDTLFRISDEDINHVKNLAREFGPDGWEHEKELGWGAFTDAASEALYFQYFSLSAEQARKQHKNPVKMLWYFILWAFTGYGIKRERFIFASGAVLLGFIFGYWWNSFSVGSGACATHYSIFNAFILSLENLQGFNNNTYTCGHFTEWLVIAEPFVGYFLLATLAALLAEELINSER